MQPERQFYHCFSCKAGGDVFRFIEETEKIGFLEAAELLSRRAGIPIPERRAGERSRRGPLLEALEAAATLYQQWLGDPRTGAMTRDYLEKRGLSPETLREFRLGYAPGVFADVGVVLLLFEVGIEVDLFALGRDHRGLMWAAPLQTVFTTALVAVVMSSMGLSFLAASVLGLCVAMSSSVVIVNITRSRRRTTDRSTEQALLGWSVLQDVTGVGLSMVLLAVANPGSRPIGVAIASIAAFVAFALVGAWLLPQVLRALRNEHDLFLIVSVASGLGLAGLGAVVFGVPLALAAFWW